MKNIPIDFGVLDSKILIRDFILRIKATKKLPFSLLKGVYF